MLDRVVVGLVAFYTGVVSGFISQKFKSLTRQEQLLSMSFAATLACGYDGDRKSDTASYTQLKHPSA